MIDHDWRPQATLAMVRQRAQLLARIRSFFAAQDVLEVDTPVLSRAAVADPHLESFVTHYRGPGLGHQRLYLHTSPELPMKRLLAAGSGSIYQIAKVFRNGESGRYHNPEFTLLEWYRVGFDQHQLMDEVETLVTLLLGADILTQPAERLSYSVLFQRHLQLDPHRASVAALKACAETQTIVPPGEMPIDDPTPWLDLLLSHCIEPHLGQAQLTFVYDYPAPQAALARLRPGDPPVAERFELYLNGIELANGFHELTDAREQRRRLQDNNAHRLRLDLPTLPLDERFLAALTSGLPDCAGVALGLERLLMVKTGQERLADVMAFPIERA